jgi:uncharacterized repeat protein (TIGR03843 family)
VACVYKPVAGERPLWDFPDGTLGHREVGAYLVAAEAARLAPDVDCVVPVTVWREDGPFGSGMCQLWVESTTEPPVDLFSADEVPDGWLPVLRARDDLDRPLVLAHENQPALRRMALLDAFTNNSDRKGGHLLVGDDGRVQGVDHGLCFNRDDKLRTVLWGWAGQELTLDERVLLDALAGAVDDGLLDERLSHAEVARTLQRAHRLLEDNAFPVPSGEWPAIPWPAF